MPNTHGKAGDGRRSPEYVSWQNMKSRCKPVYAGRSAYYDRGIAVCVRWNKFVNFLSDMGVRPPGTTLDRVDNSKGYSRSNCRWATAIVQHNNTRKNVILMAFGERKSVAAWARDPRCSVGKDCLKYRVSAGWPHEPAILRPSWRSAGSVRQSTEAR